MLRLARPRNFSATFGAPKMLLFLKVGQPFLLPPLFSYVLPDTCGRLWGEGFIKASLGGTFCGFCERFPVSTILTASGNHCRGLQPIITERCSTMGWRFSMGCLPMHNPVVFRLGIHVLHVLRVCTGQVGPDSLACCNVIT
jgi:hypothetical protein